MTSISSICNNKTCIQKNAAATQSIREGADERRGIPEGNMAILVIEIFLLKINTMNAAQ